MADSKKVIYFAATFIFRFSVFFGLSLLAVYLVLGSPKGVLKGLEEINAYNRFSDALITSAKSSADGVESSIPFNQPEISDALKKSIDPATIEKIATTMVDSTYDWLDGSKTDIQFSVDLRENKKYFAESVADYAVKRLNTLPQCFSPVSTDVFRVECYPYGLNLVDLRNNLSNQIIQSDLIVKNDVITQDILPITDGQNFTQKYPNLPKYFQVFQLLPFILMGLAVICAVIIVGFSRTIYRGLKNLSTMVISSAIILAVTPLIYTYVLPAFGFEMPQFGQQDNQDFSVIFSDLTTNLYSQINANLLNIAVQVGVLGVVLFAIAYFLRSNSSLYLKLDKKTGLTTSEKKTGKKFSTKKIYPVQTSEGPKRQRKKVSKFEKKYRKM